MMADLRITAVTCVKNEGPFLLEWIAFHRVIGVTDFLFYSNDCTDATDRLLDQLEDAVRAKGAAHMVLEVSAENGAARGLYAKAGYHQTGKRTRYYRSPDGRRIDALILHRALTSPAKR